MTRPTPPSFWRATRAVAWSFLGIRRRSDGAQDMAQVQPLHLIAIGVLGLFVLIAALLALVHWALAST